MAFNLEYFCVSVIESCNMSCASCFRVGRTGAKLQKSTFPGALEVMRRLGCRYVNFSGGEPLLHPDLGAVIELAKASRFRCILSTNGLLLRGLSDTILDNVDILALPLEGPSAEINDRIRCPGHFSKVTKLIDDYVTGSYPFLLKVNTMVSRANVEVLDQILMRLKNDHRIIWKLNQVSSRGAHNVNTGLQLADHAFLQAVAKLRKTPAVRCIIHGMQSERAGNYIIVDPDLNVFTALGDSYAMVANMQDAGLESTLGDALPFKENTFAELVLGSQ